jgi:hypothetical protein
MAFSAGKRGGAPFFNWCGNWHSDICSSILQFSYRIPGVFCRRKLQIPPDTWPSYLFGHMASPGGSQSEPRVLNRQRRAARQLLFVDYNARALAWLVTSNLASKNNTLSTLLCRRRRHDLSFFHFIHRHSRSAHWLHALVSLARLIILVIPPKIV